MLRPEVIYQQSGAKSTVNNAPVEWSLNYIGAGVGYLYTALEKESFSLSPGLVLNANYMMSGEQTIGTNRFNITEQDLLKPIDIMASLTLNSRFKVTDNLYINFDYRYGFGLMDIENIEVTRMKNKKYGTSSIFRDCLSTCKNIIMKNLLTIFL